MWYRGGPTTVRLFDDLGSCLGLQRLAAEDPRSVCEWMLTFDTALFHCQAKGACADAQESGGFRECQPVLCNVCLRVYRNAVVAAHGSDAATRPTIPPAGSQSVAIQDAGNGGVVTDASQATYRGHNVLRCCSACPAAAADRKSVV